MLAELNSFEYNSEPDNLVSTQCFSNENRVISGHFISLANSIEYNETR